MTLLPNHVHSSRRSSRAGARRGAFRLCVERLETRLAPAANVFVVPVSQPTDTTHFHELLDAINAAGPSGTVTIEPAASPDAVQPITVTKNFITIQGDPNVPATTLPAYQLSIQATDVKLTNLNLTSVVLGASGVLKSAINTVTRCLITNLTAFDAGSTYSFNAINGSANFTRDGQTGGDIITNNTFTSDAITLLSLTAAPGTVVTQNTFFGPASSTAIDVLNCGKLNNSPTLIANNTILLTGPGNTGDGIAAHQDGTSITFVKILNNTINTNGQGTGLHVFQFDITRISLLVQGNDFHNNKIGVFLVGDGTTTATVDLGGGDLLSLGGNDFRGFSRPVSLSSAAIVQTQAPFAATNAIQNIFPSGIEPFSFVFVNGQGTVAVDPALSDQRAFVQSLYNEVLGRSGSLAELDAWVNVLKTSSQAVVANAILRSPESLGRIVDSFYIRFLNRASDAAGRAAWINFLQHGGTEEQLQVAFLSSPEYLSHINTEYVQSLFINLLGHAADPVGVAFWNSKIQTLGFAGIASGFVNSPEYRLDTVRALFQTFLHRTPSDTSLQPLVNSSLDELSLEATVLGSPEFFANG
jgi:hypothetical protein